MLVLALNHVYLNISVLLIINPINNRFYYLIKVGFYCPRHSIRTVYIDHAAQTTYSLHK